MIYAFVSKNPRIYLNQVSISGVLDWSDLVDLYPWNKSLLHLSFCSFDLFLVWSTNFLFCGFIHASRSWWFSGDLFHIWVFCFIKTFVYVLFFFCPLDLRLAFSMLLCNFKQIFSFLKSFALMISFLNLWPTKIEINALSVYFQNQQTLRS